MGLLASLAAPATLPEPQALLLVALALFALGVLGRAGVRR